GPASPGARRSRGREAGIRPAMASTVRASPPSSAGHEATSAPRQHAEHRFDRRAGFRRTNRGVRRNAARSAVFQALACPNPSGVRSTMGRMAVLATDTRNAGLRLLVGPANAGKVALLLDRYLARLDDEPFLIVPNRSDVDRAERDLL